MTAMPEPNNSDYEWTVPERILATIPDEIRAEGDRLSEHLTAALEIGLQAMANAGVSLSTASIDKAMERTVEEHKRMREAFERDLNELIENELTGDESKLARELKKSFGDGGELQIRFEAHFDDLTNPDKKTSIPERVAEAIKEKLDETEVEITQALDASDPESPLALLLKRQENEVASLKTDFGQLKIALNVDELLAQKEEENAELWKKSSAKGVPFEEAAVAALQEIAGVVGDEVAHTGGQGEGGSRKQVGDIVVVIKQKGVAEMSIAIEAKSGDTGPKDLFRQTRDAVKNRGAVRGIGLMERKHMGKRQRVVEQEDDNFIVGVDWDNDDFLPLEVVYRTLRIQLLADEIRARGQEEIDVNAVRQHLTDAKNEFTLIQSMKSGASSAITTLTELHGNLGTIQSNIKDHLSKAEELL